MHPIRQINYFAIECSVRALFPEVQLSASQMRKLIEVFKKIESYGEAQTSHISSQVQPQLSLVSSSSSSNTSNEMSILDFSDTNFDRLDTPFPTIVQQQSASSSSHVPVQNICSNSSQLDSLDRRVQYISTRQMFSNSPRLLRSKRVSRVSPLENKKSTKIIKTIAKRKSKQSQFNFVRGLESQVHIGASLPTHTSMPQRSVVSFIDRDSLNVSLPTYIPAQNDSEYWVFPALPQWDYTEWLKNDNNYWRFNVVHKNSFSGNPEMEEHEWRHIQSYLPEQLQNQIGRDILNTIIRLYLHVNLYPSCYNENLNHLHPTVQQKLRNLVLVHAPRFFDRFVGFFNRTYQKHFLMDRKYENFKLNTPLFEGITDNQYETLKRMIVRGYRLSSCPIKSYVNSYVARALAWPDKQIEEKFGVSTRNLNRHFKELLINKGEVFSFVKLIMHTLSKGNQDLIPFLSFFLI